jgi:Fe-S-cluster containining protein
MPAGHVLLGYDERGHCPMLVEGQCSIYDHRPRTCRTYDCRVFPAAGIEVEPEKELIAQRVRRWRFTVVAPEDQIRLDAVRAAARVVDEASPTGRAVLAIERHARFLPGARADAPYPADPDE